MDSYDFFKLFGLSEVHAVDVSSYEGADIVINLADELPDELYNKFDYVIDAGTLEHIFDAATAMKNMTNMVKTGGHIVHILPLSGWIEHGFYSFSPTFFGDFYYANQFKMKCLDAELLMNASDPMEQVGAFSQDFRLFKDPIKVNKYMQEIMRSGKFERALIWCVAQKKEDNHANIYPMQGMCQVAHSQALPLDWASQTVHFIEQNSDKKIVLYGTGEYGNMLIDELYRHDMERSIQYVLNSNIKKAGSTYRGYKVLYPTRAKLESVDIILISNKLYVDEIYSILEDIGPEIAEKTYKLSQVIAGGQKDSQ